jgi:Fe-S-cluster containining protein
MSTLLNTSAMNSIFTDCRQCGACCKRYRKIPLAADEVEFIKRMGGHVGVDVTLSELRERPLSEVVQEAKKAGKVYMIHPDNKGCIFLEKRDKKYYCKIYHYRPRVCRGFRCNLVDDSFLNILGDDAINLLGQNSFGLPLQDD